ncbi:MAG: hypothetical protein ACYC61_05400 [Isosphaeraceae bacterium]
MACDKPGPPVYGPLRDETNGAQRRSAGREAARQEDGARRDIPRPEIERQIGRLKERLQDLLAKERTAADARIPELRAEIREEIEGTERELHALRDRLEGGGEPRPEFEAHARKIEEAARRIHHIRVAAENLKAAGIHDLARKLTEKAEILEREVRDARERLARQAQHPRRPDPRDAEIRELRRQNERLHAEIRELRREHDRP